ncbi:general transcription factor IIE subunit 1-like [Pecten maximus]|uniref:general transcription factor IIE subunit 1-like n=1 Tax=Pecten maximus TaxID=6579 RepID=UPI0014585610|nr:general transcription factor IIE subunit 1-like [Pecten maximus]
MNEPDILTEVPETLKRLARLIARGFYSMEHAIVIDLLVRNPCMKEDDIAELLKFDRKHLRALLNTLKNEKFVKMRMKVETDVEGKSTRHNYYFIGYQVFVNVVKYKLDHVRRKIEMEERDNTSRASFKCPSCCKSYTDLEADQLFDFMSQTFRCTFCECEVEEDESAMPKKDARTLLAKFNEQIQSVFDLLKECDDIKLAPELMEPEPTDIKHLKSHSTSKPSSNKEGESRTWSGDATRGTGFGYTDMESNVTITMDTEEEIQKRDKQNIKDRPEWMVKSTVQTTPSSDVIDLPDRMDIAGPSGVEPPKHPNTNEIETLLIIHEKKRRGPPLPGASGIQGPDSNSSSSDSEDERTNKPKPAAASVEEMESDEEESIPMVNVDGEPVPYHEVTDDMVAKMSAVEKEEYIRIGQEMYQDMYE